METSTYGVDRSPRLSDHLSPNEDGSAKMDIGSDGGSVRLMSAVMAGV